MKIETLDQDSNNDIIQLDAEELKKEFPKHVYLLVRAEELQNRVKELKNEIKNFVDALDSEIGKLFEKYKIENYPYDLDLIENDKVRALIEVLEFELENWQKLLNALDGEQNEC
jgi:FtsZ-binding cell division protein ZapB